MLTEIGSHRQRRRLHRRREGGQGPAAGLRPPGLQELRPAGHDHQEDRRTRSSRSPARTRCSTSPSSSKRSRWPTTTSSAASSTRTSTSTRASSTRRWASRSRCSPVLFAIPRTSGWLAHWLELLEQDVAHRPAPPALRRRRRRATTSPHRRSADHARPVMPLADVTQIDAFTDRPFAGNPAAVVLLDEPADDGVDAGGRRRDEPVRDRVPVCRWRPTVATTPTWSLRWFTPDGRGRPVRPRHPGLGPPPVHRARRIDDAAAASSPQSASSLDRGPHWPDGLDRARPAGRRPGAGRPARPACSTASGSTTTTVVAAAQGRTDLLVEVADADAVRGRRSPITAALRRPSACAA